MVIRGCVRNQQMPPGLPVASTKCAGWNLTLSSIPGGILLCLTSCVRKALPLSLRAISLLSKSYTESLEGNCSYQTHPIKSCFLSKQSWLSCDQGWGLHCWWNTACKCVQGSGGETNAWITWLSLERTFSTLPAVLDISPQFFTTSSQFLPSTVVPRLPMWPLWAWKELIVAEKWKKVDLN